MNISSNVHKSLLCGTSRCSFTSVSLPGSDELTSAAIARLANVGRAAVSNWRRRYPDFPQPVGGSEVRPTFSRSEVEAWLVSTGKADQLATAGCTETGTRAIGDVHLGGLSVADLTAGQLLAKVMVSLLPRPTADVSPVDADTDPVDAGDLPAIVDPACADGALLVAVADRFGDRVRLAGQEGNERAAALTASRLRGHPHDPTYEIHVGDSQRDNRLHEYLGAAAAVVCKPPSDRAEWPPASAADDSPWNFGVPGPRDRELVWVQHCLALLRPRGVAVVAVSPRTCVQSSGRHIRAELVRAGALRDVIALPKGMGTPSGSDVYLWVLQRPLGPPSQTTVRMTNLSGVADAADVPREHATWQRLFSDGDSAICSVVAGTDLADGEADLLPSHHVASRTDATVDDLVRVTERLRALYALLGRGLPRFGASQTQSKHEPVTLGELERRGALTILSREATPRKGDLILRTMGRPPVVATGTDADDVGIAQVVELDGARLDQHFVATFVWADAASLPVANMVGALSRDDLRRCRIPRMPIAEQRRYGAAFRRLRELEGALTALARLSASVVDETVRGLTAGVLAPDLLIPKNNGAQPEGETRQL